MAGLDQPLICPVLVGRDADLAQIDALAASARTGEQRILLISGEAGIGKTRLVRAGADLLSSQGWLVLDTTCFEQDNVPFAPVSRLVERLHRFAPDLVENRLSSYTRVFTWLTAEPATSASVNDDTETEHLADAVRGLLQEVCAQRPCVLIVEDLQWCSQQTLDLLLNLIREQEASHLLVILTYRTDERPAPLGAFLASLDRTRNAVELTLQRLNLTDTDRMLRVMLSQSRSTRVEFLYGLFRLTEGNPFFIEELLRSLLNDTDLDQLSLTDLDSARIPRTVQEAVRRRMETLSGDAKRLLELAAVVGVQFEFGLLQSITGSSEEDLLARLRELLAAQLVIEDTEDRFAFRHALTRQTVLSALLGREKRLLHEQIAAASERLYGDSLDPHIEDLAYHYFEARAWPKARHYAERAGRKALETLTPVAAVEQFNHALDAAGENNDSTLAGLYLARATGYDALGDFDRALADYLQALEAAAIEGNQQVELDALLGLGMLWSSRDYAQSLPYYERASDLARRMGDSRGLGNALKRLANWHSNAGHFTVSVELLTEALDLFRSLDDQHGVAETLDLLGMTSLMGARADQSVAYFQAAAAMFEVLADKRNLISSLASIAILCGTYQSQMLAAPLTLPQAEMFGLRALELAREIDVPAALSYALWQLGFCLGPQGKYGQALAYAEESLAIAQRISHHQWQAAAHGVLGSIYTDLLQPDIARSHLEQAMAIAREIKSPLWVDQLLNLLASAMVLQGNVDQALACLDAPANVADLTAPTSMGDVWRLSALAEAKLAAGEHAAVLMLVGLLNGGGPGGPWLQRLRGRAFAGLGRTDEAIACLEQAERSALTQNNRSQSWRIQADLTTLLFGLSDRPKARLWADRALEATTELAANADDAEVGRRFLESAALFLPGALRRRPQRAPVDELTARETEIASLVAEGMSNRAIAEALVLSSRTIETHIANAMAKLGFNSRSQLAAWAVERNRNPANPRRHP